MSGLGDQNYEEAKLEHPLNSKLGVGVGLGTVYSIRVWVLILDKFGQYDQNYKIIK
jgi:hypothetical protein